MVRVVGDLLGIIWILFLVQAFVPILPRQALAWRRQNVMRQSAKARGSRVITMIHRQETMRLLGFPITRSIGIEDSEEILRAIRMTPDEMPVDLVLHTPGGLVLASEQIAAALAHHPGKVTVFVPHYAMSGGTLVALAADEIVMDSHAVLGPLDPQLGGPRGGYYPAASILRALEEPNPNRDDHILILGDMARKAISQVYETVYELLLKHHEPERAAEIARALSEGRWTHDYPISYERAREMGLPVSDQMDRKIYQLMDLYPQSLQRRPGVEYIPAPYQPPPSPRRSDFTHTDM